MFEKEVETVTREVFYGTTNTLRALVKTDADYKQLFHDFINEQYTSDMAYIKATIPEMVLHAMFSTYFCENLQSPSAQVISEL